MAVYRAVMREEVREPAVVVYDFENNTMTRNGVTTPIPKSK
jgi:hypothetical protein